MTKKHILKIFLAIIFVLINLSYIQIVFTFHSSTGLICNKCHTMHYSEDNAVPVGGDAGGPFPKLLIKKNKTDLCLSCHSDATKAPDVYNTVTKLPGGDFNDVTTGNENNGHNPYGKAGNVSANIPADPTLGLTPPGGAALTEFTCVDCHGPHGGTNEVFLYRNLALVVNGTTLTSANFVAADVDEATIWSGAANQAEGAANHNVYKTDASGFTATKGFGKWCSTCHGNFHGAAKTDANVGDTVDWIRHPTATKLTTSIVGNYVTHDYTYPVETKNAGAGTAANWALNVNDDGVNCLSCHRAHSSTNAFALRWTVAAQFGDSTGCNKCHGK